MPESGVTKHNYLFCQFVNPACGHEGDRCDCFDTPSQRRTTLAKQRLARLRANREVNRASTSNDPESAVASDPAVTPTAPRTTRTRPITPSRWRPDLLLALPNPSINNPFQNTPSTSPWATATKKPKAVQTEARVRSWVAPRLLSLEEGMPPRRPPTPTPYEGGPGAPYHRPQPSDTKPLRQWVLPHIPSTEPPKENLPFLGFAPPRCYFCRDLRHAEKDCLEPHQRCKRDRQCVVPRRHPHFEELCPFGAERGRWQTTAGWQDTCDFPQKCGTTLTTQLAEYYDDSELRTIDLQSPTPTSTPDNPSTEIQKDLYDPAWSGPNTYIPTEGGNGGLVADSVGADSYRGGNVTNPPTHSSSTGQ